jgi:metallo-beta-lactamase family protein
VRRKRAGQSPGERSIVGIKLSFLGATQNVTGSRYLLECNGSRVLVDCGLYQERALRERNYQGFPVRPDTLDVVLLTHAHLDHCGFIPRLVKDGFRGTVYSTPATAEIAQIAFLDYAHLQTEDTEFKRRRHAREGRKGRDPLVPLYTDRDADASMRHFDTVEYGKSIRVGHEIEATFHDAGHILGSAMIDLSVRVNGALRTLIFSGDIGRWGKPILNDPTVFTDADYVTMESTYGDRLHEDSTDIDSMLVEVVTSTKQKRGNVLIPSFAIERTQEVLYRLNALFLKGRIPHMPVFIDSPMAQEVTQVFKRHRELFDEEMNAFLKSGNSPFSFKGLRMVGSIEESKAINRMKESAIIIAGSGMCTGGRIKHHLVYNISRPESVILFVGYQAEGTLGREIVEGAAQVRILGQSYPVLARVLQIQGFSAHADKAELLRWVSGLKAPPKHVFVTHGEAEVARKFADTLRTEKHWSVSVPSYEQAVDLD